MSSKKIEIRVTLEEEISEKLDVIKTFYGIKNNTEIVRLLITEKFRDIKRQSK